MKKLLSPACLLFYVLTLPVFFILGAAIAGLSGVAKGQGLAGGAIVFFYAVVAAIVALIIAIIVAQRVDHSKIVLVNKILAIVLVALISLLTYRYQIRENKEKPATEDPLKKTSPVGMIHQFKL